MPTIAITGTTRDVGLELLKQVSADPNNLVIGINRNPDNATTVIESELPGRENIRVVKGDLNDRVSLKKAAQEVAAITGGSLDVLYVNGATSFIGLDAIGELAVDKPDMFQDQMTKSFNTNVLGNSYLIGLFAPLIRAGMLKKVVILSTGLADPGFIADNKINFSVPYGLMKCALNYVTACFHAEYSSEGILIMAIALPPLVTSLSPFKDIPPELMERVQRLGQAFAAYEPSFRGPPTPEEPIAAALKVVEGATIETHGGKMTSHHGNRRWLP